MMTTRTKKTLTDATIATIATDATVPNVPTDATVPTVPNVPTDATVPNVPTDATVPNVPTDATVPNVPTDATVPNVPNVPTDAQLHSACAEHAGLKSKDICAKMNWNPDLKDSSGKTTKMRIAGIIAGNSRSGNSTGNAAPALKDAISLPVTRESLGIILDRMQDDCTITRIGGTYTVHLSPVAVTAYITATLQP